MKHILVYDTSTNEIVMRFVVTDCTRPWCVLPSKWVEFDTEAEMLAYIAENELEIQNETI
jgi:hypothetical protein